MYVRACCILCSYLACRLCNDRLSACIPGFLNNTVANYCFGWLSTTDGSEDFVVGDLYGDSESRRRMTPWRIVFVTNKPTTMLIRVT